MKIRPVGARVVPRGQTDAWTKAWRS